ncbi:hypothetical protein D3C71_1924840 [compost metagenome]
MSAAAETVIVIGSDSAKSCSHAWVSFAVRRTTKTPSFEGMPDSVWLSPSRTRASRGRASLSDVRWVVEPSFQTYSRNWPRSSYAL